MKPRGRWGLRRLILAFISVWIVGCNTVQRITPLAPPTGYPPITLIVRTLAPSTSAYTTITPASATLHPVATPEADQTPYIATDANLPPGSTPMSLPLRIEAPTCYETDTDTIVCLGLVDNNTNQIAGQVVVLVQLLYSDGTQLAAQTIAVEQHFIPPGTSAPYRTLFRSIEGIASVGVSLQNAEAVSQDYIPYVTLEVENIHARMVEGRYIVSARVYNPGTWTAQSWRVIVTLQDAERRVTGYRVVQMDRALSAGQRLPIRIEVLSLVTDIDQTHTLYIEAWENGE